MPSCKPAPIPASSVARCLWIPYSGLHCEKCRCIAALDHLIGNIAMIVYESQVVKVTIGSFISHFWMTSVESFHRVCRTTSSPSFHYELTECHFDAVLWAFMAGSWLSCLLALLLRRSFSSYNQFKCCRDNSWEQKSTPVKPEKSLILFLLRLICCTCFHFHSAILYFPTARQTRSGRRSSESYCPAWGILPLQRRHDF